MKVYTFLLFSWLVFSSLMRGCLSVSTSNSEQITKTAIEKLSEAQKNESKNPEVSSKLAGEAFQEFEAVREGDPNNSKNFYLIGKALANHMYLNEGDEFLKLGIDVFPKSNLKGRDSVMTFDGLYFNRYLIQKARNNLEKAIEVLEPVKDKYPQLIIQSKMELGYALYEKKKYQKAILLLETSLKKIHETHKKFPSLDLSSQAEKTSYYLAQCYHELGKDAQVITEAYKLAVESYPGNYNILSRFVASAQNSKTLDDYLDLYVKKSDTNATICLLLALVYDEIEKINLSKRYYEKYNKLLKQ